jgi:hypothetical protein
MKISNFIDNRSKLETKLNKCKVCGEAPNLTYRGVIGTQLLEDKVYFFAYCQVCKAHTEETEGLCGYERAIQNWNDDDVNVKLKEVMRYGGMKIDKITN